MEGIISASELQPLEFGFDMYLFNNEDDDPQHDEFRVVPIPTCMDYCRQKYPKFGAFCIQSG